MKTNILSWKTANIVSYLVNKQEKKLGVEHMRRRKTSAFNKSREKLSTLRKENHYKVLSVCGVLFSLSFALTTFSSYI